MQDYRLLVLDGDGIGPEVCNETVRFIEFFSEKSGARFNIEHGLIGGSAFDMEGTPLHDNTIKKAKESHSILLGAVGGPKWESLPIENRPEKGLLKIRQELGLFANLRPALVFDELIESSSLKPEILSGLDILIVRELTGGLYFGQPRGVSVNENGEQVGVNTLIYTESEIKRIAKVAFELSAKRGKSLCSIDKANVLEATEMWREIVQTMGDSEYKDIKLSHMYVDNAAMQLVRNPKQFDVLVTTNMFGDILSDISAMLTGSLGMLPSASLGERRECGSQYSLYEPVHGSAPDIVGTGKANPIATILSFAMMLRYSFSLEKEANALESAIKVALSKQIRTPDIALNKNDVIVSTKEMSDEIFVHLKEIYKL